MATTKARQSLFGLGILKKKFEVFIRYCSFFVVLKLIYAVLNAQLHMNYCFCMAGDSGRSSGGLSGHGSPSAEENTVVKE